MKKKRLGLLIVIILAVLAVVLAVVFILLFKDKNTKGLAQDLNTVVTQQYLSEDSDEYKTITEYLNGYLDNNKTGTGTDRQTEVENCLNSYEAYVGIAVFFNNEAPFMEYTKAYKTNRSKIVKNLNSAESSAKDMISKINAYKNTTGGSGLWETVVWDNAKQYMFDMISSTMTAFELLSNVYSASVSSDLLNNDLTDVLFMGMKYLNKDFIKNISTTANLGLKIKTFSDNTFAWNSFETAVLGYSYTSDNYKAAVKELKTNGENSQNWSKVLDGTFLSTASI